MDDDVKRWMGKVEEMRTGVDLSRDEDLSIALMNLISLEEHSYFTAMKTGNSKYLDMLDSVRQLRKRLLGKIVVNPKGEEWCISKHLLAASMRLIEVGTKELSGKNSKEAEFCFKAAFELYSLFFAVNLDMLGKSEIKVKDGKVQDGFGRSGFSAIISKIVNCCRE